MPQDELGASLLVPGESRLSSLFYSAILLKLACNQTCEPLSNPKRKLWLK